MNHAAALIRRARTAASLPEQSLAAALGISIAAYHDLELHDDEFETTISLAQARALATVLHLRLSELVASASAIEPVSLDALARHLLQKVASDPTALVDAEEKVGWELSSFASSPEHVAGQRPLVFLRDLSTFLGIQWESVLVQLDEA